MTETKPKRRSFRFSVSSRRFLIGTALGLFLLVSATRTHAEVTYTISDLGSLTGTISEGRGISANGKVTGFATLAGDIDYHAFLYDGSMHDLGTLGGSLSDGYGVNDSGQVVGQSATGGSANDFYSNHAFLYDRTMHDLGTLGGSYSLGTGINNRGLVSGSSGINGTDATGHAFMYDGALHDLGTLGGSAGSIANGINDSGQVTGEAFLSGNLGPHSFLYDGVMHDLGVLGGLNSSSGRAINANGDVTGISWTADGQEHAFLDNGTMHDLGTLGGTFSIGLGINASRQVIGVSTTINSGEIPFLYSSGTGMVDLNSLIDPAEGWVLATANAINDAGQITGQGLIGGQYHAYLLTPVPEPQSLALLAGGGLILCWGKCSGTLAWTWSIGIKSSVSYIADWGSGVPILTVHYRWADSENVRIPIRLQFTPTQTTEPRIPTASKAMLLGSGKIERTSSKNAWSP